MNISSGVSNLIGIPTRNHYDLQNLNHNDHPFYSAEPNRIAQTSFTEGLDASKSATPSVGAVYYATDTVKLYECFATNVWTQVSDICIPAGPTTGDIIYYDGVKWNRLAAGAVGTALIGNGAGSAPSFGTPPALTLVSAQNITAGSSPFTSSAFTAYTFMRFVVVQQSASTSNGIYWQFNSDTGNNYASRGAFDNGTTVTSVSTSSIVAAWGVSGIDPQIHIAEVTNFLGVQKILRGYSAASGGAVSTAPVLSDYAGVWSNTSEQITTVTIGGSGTTAYTAGDRLLIYGSN